MWYDVIAGDFEEGRHERILHISVARDDDNLRIIGATVTITPSIASVQLARLPAALICGRRADDCSGWAGRTDDLPTLPDAQHCTRWLRDGRGAITNGPDTGQSRSPGQRANAVRPTAKD